MNAGPFTGTPQVPARFEVLGELGRGGMAVVYHAYDLAGERDVALKFLYPTQDEQLKKRFQREANDLAAIFHPNIVDFYALGESHGYEYIEMEYVDGGDLGEFAQNCQSLEHLLEVFIKVCDGLEHIHRCGVVHRDLKPGNVLMTKEGEPKISDLGLARREEGRSQLTQDGALLGTASYLAPEQLMSHEVGPSADLYALGVCLFEAVTHQHPFKAVGTIPMFRAHLDETPPAPSSVATGITPRLDRLILSLLEKDPLRRPTTAAEVGQELQACILEATSAQENLASARESVSECRSGQSKQLGEALLVLGQAATAAEQWEEALLSLQEARDLIPSKQRDLQVSLMNSLAVLHESGSGVGQPGLSKDEARRFREIAQGLARREESLKIVPALPSSPALPALPEPSQLLTPAALPATPPRKAPRRGLFLALLVLSVFLVGGVAYQNWPEKLAELEVEADRQGAIVLIDDIRHTSPHKGELKAGTYKIKVFAQGFKSHEESVTLEPGQAMKLKVNLKPASGNLKLASKPVGAKLFVNGQAKGKTPADLNGLAPKKLKVKLVKEGYKPYEGTVDVVAGQTKNLSFAMEKLPPPPPPKPRYVAPAVSSYSGGSSSGRSSSRPAASAPSYTPAPTRRSNIPRFDIPARVEVRAPRVEVGGRRVKVRFP